MSIFALEIYLELIVLALVFEMLLFFFIFAL